MEISWIWNCIRNEIYAFVSADSAISYFVVFDSVLAPIDTSSMGNADFVPTDFSVSGNRIHSVGLLSQHSQIFMYQQQVKVKSTSQFLRSLDIGITKIDLQNITQTVYMVLPSNQTLYYIDMDIYATIKNFSTDIINHFYISSPIYSGINCLDFVYNRDVVADIQPLIR